MHRNENRHFLHFRFTRISPYTFVSAKPRITLTGKKIWPQYIRNWLTTASTWADFVYATCY